MLDCLLSCCLIFQWMQSNELLALCRHFTCTLCASLLFCIILFFFSRRQRWIACVCCSFLVLHKYRLVMNHVTLGRRFQQKERLMLFRFVIEYFICISYTSQCNRLDNVFVVSESNYKVSLNFEFHVLFIFLSFQNPSQIPKTNFHCKGRPAGYYADIEAGEWICNLLDWFLGTEIAD